MGAKTALLAFADGDVPSALLGATRFGRSEAEKFVRRVYPGYGLAPADDGTLEHGVYPADGITYATVLAGVDLICDRRLMFDRPSELPAHLLAIGAGRRIVVHGMHSVSDWLSFAVWEDGRLIRSLSLSPDGGIGENIGQPYDFELPYWAGERPVEPQLDWHAHRPYPLPFHPLELGEDALSALFGLSGEGLPDQDGIAIADVHLHGFQATDPSGREQAERQALQAVIRRMRPPRRYQMGSEGTLHEISDGT
jgi:hypothetical protein